MNRNHAISLADIIRGVQGNKVVTWQDPNSERLICGTMRRLRGDFNDVLANEIEITSKSGLEMSVSVPDALALIDQGLFAIGYDVSQ